MRKALHWTIERAILALFALLLCAPPTLARSGKVIKLPAPNTPGLQRRARSLNLAPLPQHQPTQARLRPRAVTRLRAPLAAGKVAAPMQQTDAEWEIWKDDKRALGQLTVDI